MMGIWEAGMICYTSVIIIANLRVLLISHNVRYYLLRIIVFASIGVYIIVLMILDDLVTVPLLADNIYRGMFALIFANPNMWSGFVFIFATTTLLDMAM